MYITWNFGQRFTINVKHQKQTAVDRFKLHSCSFTETHAVPIFWIRSPGMLLQQFVTHEACQVPPGEDDIHVNFNTVHVPSPTKWHEVTYVIFILDDYVDVISSSQFLHLFRFDRNPHQLNKRIEHKQRVEGGWWAWTLVHQGQFHDFPTQTFGHISQVLQVCCDAVALHTYYTVTHYISSICNIHI